MWSFERKKQQMVSPDAALPGRAQPMLCAGEHSVFGRPLVPPFPSNCGQILFGMGCFWGAERVFWSQPGVYLTAVGYSGGYTPNPTYEEVCSGLTGHNEVVLVVYSRAETTVEALLRVFWQNHNPTTLMQQANDIGTQYRSGVYCYESSQLEAALQSRAQYQSQLGEALPITTEVKMAEVFYWAEGYHQQYLAKNPGGYCNLQTVAKTGLPIFAGQ